MNEIFKPIPGMPNCQASNYGRIKAIRRGKLQILNQFRRVRNYLGVSITLNGVRRSYLVHRLVLLAFCGEPPEKYEGIHLNNIQNDNKLSNLKWGTHAENMMMDRGNNHSHKGENNPNCKLTKEQVLEIRLAFSKRKGDGYKWGCKEFAEQFNVSQKQISIIANNRNGGWKNI